MPGTMNEIACPKCSGAMWDNRLTKKNPKQPDFKCKDKACDGVIWPPRPGAAQNGHAAAKPAQKGVDIPPLGTMPFDQNDIPTPADDDVVGEAELAKLKLRAIFRLQEVCFTHALKLATSAEQSGIPVTLDGVSALTAQAFIAAGQRGVTL